MKAVYYDAFATPPRVQQVADPAPTPGGVVIKVEATGLCRSDWHGWMGHDPDIVLPHVPGHEFAGVISAVGKNVTRWHVGDRVTVPFVCGCGRCPECESGNPQVCPNQFQPGFTRGVPSPSKSPSTTPTRTSSGYRTGWTRRPPRASDAASRLLFAPSSTKAV
jgi:D-arabinose 1-dehydrogenase-like Zn-dependent alcohol dehydrogenase